MVLIIICTQDWWPFSSKTLVVFLCSVDVCTASAHSFLNTDCSCYSDAGNVNDQYEGENYCGIGNLTEVHGIVGTNLSG